MPESDFVDYYELLQISPNAEMETVHRVFRMLATRYHPDNMETGDTDKFLLLNKAYETLSDPAARGAYDTFYAQRNAEPIELFELKEFSLGIDAEANRRMGILCLLYNRRRSNPEDPGLSILEFESMMSFPREHLMFTIWYLKEQGYIRQDDRSDYVIASGGVDYVEANLTKNKLAYRLLNSAENGTKAGARETREPA
jgi:curved DNA-binding protein CbpA